MTLSLLDCVFLALILLVIIKVTLSGFVTEFFSKAALIIGLIGAVLFYGRLSPYIVSLIGTDVYPDIISFLVIFLSLYLLIKLIQQLVGSAFQGETMTNLDRALGFFLGIVEGCLLVAILLLGIRLQPWLDLSSLTSGSTFARLFEPFLSEGRLFFSGIIPAI